MTWSLEVSATKDAAIAEVSKRFDDAAKGYEGREEAKDVLVAKERAMQALNAFKPEDWGRDGKGQPYNGVRVYAYGSRLGDTGGLTMHVEMHPAVVAVP